MNRELDFVREMFDTIAPKYDFLNRLLSLRQDLYWRREMVRAACLPKTPRVLDAACGTCDVALETRAQTGSGARIFGLDFSFGMLALGKKKLIRQDTGSGIGLINGDALALPFAENLFDGVFIAFGIRNIIDRERAVRSFLDVLKPGRRMVILELTTPENRLLKSLYLVYFKKILPLIGSFFSKDRHAYRYLPESVVKFPSNSEFTGLIRRAGFEKIRYKPMTFGIVTLFVGVKPAGRS